MSIKISKGKRRYLIAVCEKLTAKALLEKILRAAPERPRSSGPALDRIASKLLKGLTPREREVFGQRWRD